MGRREESLKSRFQPVTMALMLEGVLADRLTKNEMLPYWLKREKKPNQTQRSTIPFESQSSENKV